MQAVNRIVFRPEIWIMVLCWTLFGSAHAQDQEGYRVAPEDILHISVWHEEGLDQEVLVAPDGRITFPLAGIIRAAGRTLDEIRDEIAQRIEKYVPQPVVTVALKANRGYKVYVIGNVQKPGEFVAGSYIDVMKALSLAGGLTRFAAENKIKVLRRENGGQKAIPFDYAEVVKGRQLEQNIILQTGDVVVVP